MLSENVSARILLPTSSNGFELLAENAIKLSIRPEVGKRE
jgi:hypothetical protein